MPRATLRPYARDRYKINWDSEQAQGLISCITFAPGGAPIDWVRNAAFSLGTSQFHEGRILRGNDATRTGDSFTQTLLKRSYVIWTRSTGAVGSGSLVPLYQEGPNGVGFFRLMVVDSANYFGDRYRLGIGSGRNGVNLYVVAISAPAVGGNLGPHKDYELQCTVITFETASMTSGASCTGKGYVVGLLQETTAGTLPAAGPTAERTSVVHTLGSNGGYSNLAEFRSYNRILSAAEVWRIWDRPTRDSLFDSRVVSGYRAPTTSYRLIERGTMRGVGRGTMRGM